MQKTTPEGKLDAIALGLERLRKGLLDLAGTVSGPIDMARNHDHYIHGTPKK